MKVAAVLCAISVLMAAPRERKDPVAIKAEAAFRAERWDEAADGFERAYDNDPQLKYLFAWAQAERKRGACDRAVELYDAYVLLAESAGDVPDDKLETVRAARAECVVAEPEPPPPPPPPPVLVAEPERDDEPRAEETDAPRPWHRDPLGASLVGVGAGVLVAGVATRLIARGRSDDARAASSEGQFEDDYDRSTRLGTTGLVLIGAGAVVAVAGVVRWAVLARRQSKTGQTATARILRGTF